MKKIFDKDNGKDMDDTPLNGQMEMGELFMRKDKDENVEKKVGGVAPGQMSLLHDAKDIKEHLLYKVAGRNNLRHERKILKNFNQKKTTFEVKKETKKDKNLGKDLVKKSATKSKAKKEKLIKNISKKIDEKNTKNLEDSKKHFQLYYDIKKKYREEKNRPRKVGEDVFKTTDKNFKKSKINMNEKVYYENSGGDIINGIISKNLDSVLHECMIPYAEYVIMERALPRVEDGLKPVQRRILYSMFELGLTPDKPNRKCARIVGDCLGKYHPHGDVAVYDALVRMAQPFNYNEVLVTGEGNFGSIDGDSAAAMRYTEAKLSPLAMELLRDLDKNTVRWALNFDDTLKEPEMLPGRFPNLLVNGSSGIAVGLATNIPPHNLGEVIDGVIAYIDNSTISLKEMMKIIKGPDFPTGGYILPSSELEEAYATGRGKIYLRAKMHVENPSKDKKSLVITELPYQVNKAMLLQKIAMLKSSGKVSVLSGISEIRDESDREGMRAVIRLKKDADAKRIYDYLLKNTELQVTFGVNMVAIAGGKPEQMTLLDIIAYYAEYQRNVILKRSQYELEQAVEKAHILKGLIIAIQNIELVIKIVRTSKNTSEAKERLTKKFKLSDPQAQAILDMRLARLTNLEVHKLEEEYKKLQDLIASLEKVVASKKRQFGLVKKELLEIKEKYMSPRRTHFAGSTVTLKLDEMPKKIEEKKRLIVLKSASQTFKAVSEKQFSLSSSNFNEKSDTDDIYTLKLNIKEDATLLAFSNRGNCYKEKVSKLGESRLKDKGLMDWTLFRNLAKDEDIIAIFNSERMNGEGNLLFYTKYGMVKKTSCKEYTLMKRLYQAIKLKKGDEVLKVEFEPKAPYDIVFVTRDGMILNAKSDDIPLQKRISRGVKGIALSPEDYCIGISSYSKSGFIICANLLGGVKRTNILSIPESVRYRKGLKISGDPLILGEMISSVSTVILLSMDGAIYSKLTKDIPLTSRTEKFKGFLKGRKKIAVKDAYLLR